MIIIDRLSIFKAMPRILCFNFPDKDWLFLCFLRCKVNKFEVRTFGLKNNNLMSPQVSELCNITICHIYMQHT